MRSKFQKKTQKSIETLCPKRLVTLVSSVIITLFSCSAILANPVGGQITAGQATIQQVPASTVITQTSNQAIIDWKSFNIAPNEKTHFQQPSVNAITLNRINPSQGVSQILGAITANGQIILVNQAGIYFGSGARIDVGSLIASTSDISNENFMAGKYIFNQPSSLGGTIVNRGVIIAHDNGLVALIGGNVSNEGIIQAKLGRIALASGNQFTVNLSNDSLINFVVIDDAATKDGISAADGKQLNSAVSNSGKLIANGGTILLTAKSASRVLDNVIDMQGIAIANSVALHNGQIILTGEGGAIIISGTLLAAGKNHHESGGNVKVIAPQVALLKGAVIDVSGQSGGGTIYINGDATLVDSNVILIADALKNGNGGEVSILSKDNTLFYGSIYARAGIGNGGAVEVSGGNLSFAGYVDTSSVSGVKGTLLLDPTSLYIVNGVAMSGDQDAQLSGGTINFSTPDTNRNTISVGTLQALGNTNIILQATDTLTVGDASGRAASVNLTGLTSNTLTLQSGNGSGGAGNIIFNTGSSLVTNGGNVSIVAGQNGDSDGTANLGAITTNGGNLSVIALGAVNLIAAINTGSGTIAVKANQIGLSNNFVMNSGSSLSTSNASNNAVAINVNRASGGTGSATLNSISTGAGGTISVSTNTGANASGGSITTNGGVLSVGTNGVINLSVPLSSSSAIGSTNTSIVTSGNNLTANLTTGLGGAFINNSGTLLIGSLNRDPNGSLTITDSGNLTLNNNLNMGAGNLMLAANNGTLTINGSISSSSGNIKLSAAPNTNVGDVNINNFISSTTGYLNISNSRNLTINSFINTQGITLTAQGAVNFINTLNALSGTVAINVNGNAGTNNFIMDASNAIVTTNTSANAVVIHVNNGGGSGDAILSNITTGNGGTISVTTNYNNSTSGGSISQLSGTLLNAGALGTIILSVPTTSTSSIQSEIFGGNLRLASGKNGSVVTSPNAFTLTQYNSNPRASLSLSSADTLAVSATVQAGLVNLSANNGITVSNNLNGYGPMVVNANANNNGAGILTVTNQGVINTSGYDLAITASDINLSTTGQLNSGQGLLTVNASGANSSIGFGSTAGGTLNFNDAEVNNIKSTGPETFNAANGITFSTNYSTTGALILNADKNNTGVGVLTVNNNALVNTNNTALTVYAGDMNLNTSGILNAGTSTITIIATGTSSSIGLGDGAGGSLNLSTIELLQLMSTSHTYNANDGLHITTNYVTLGNLIVNADFDNSGSGFLNIDNNVQLTATNNLLSLTAATMYLGVGSSFNSGTGNFILTATSELAPSLGLGDGSSGAITLTTAQLNVPNLIVAGSRTFNGNNGIDVTTDPANNFALTLNADFNNNGVGLLQLANNVTINTANNSLSLTAATLSLGTNSIVNSGTGNFSLTATGISPSSVPPSLAIGDGMPGLITVTDAQWNTQVIATGARVLQGRDGLYINENLNNNSALTLDADQDKNGIGILTIVAGNIISSGNQALSVTAATDGINNVAFQHGAGALTLNGTGFNAPSLGLGDTAGGDFNVSDITLANSTGVNNSGPLTFTGVNGVVVAYTIPNTQGNTLTFNADTNADGSGTFRVNPGFDVNANNSTLVITAADLNLSANTHLNSGTMNTLINATGSLGIGTALGTMTISNAELQTITASNLVLSTNNNSITSTSVSLAGVANISDAVTLTANPASLSATSSNPNSLGATVNFINGASDFNNVIIQGASGININSNINSQGYVTVGNVADDFLNNISVGGNETVSAVTGIQINNSASISGGSTLTLNADSSANHVSDLTVAAGTSLGLGAGNLSIITNDLLLNGVINLGSGNITVAGTGSVGLGLATGQLTLDEIKLNRITANNLTVNSGLNSDITVNGANISPSNPANHITGSVILNAVQATGTINFVNTDSEFNSLSATANSGINLDRNVTVKNTMNLTANGASDITQMPGFMIVGTATNSTLNLRTGSGDALLTNVDNSFRILSANSTSGNLRFINSTDRDLQINTSNVGAGNFTVETQGDGAITQAGVISGATLSIVTDSGNANLSTSNNNVTNFAATSTSGNVSFLDGNGFNVLSSNVNNGNLSLLSYAGNITQSGVISGAQLNTLTTSGNVLFGDYNNQFSQIATNSTSGSTSYRQDNGFVIGASNLGTGDLSLFTQSGDVSQNNGIAGNQLSLTTTSGNITLNRTDNNFISVQATANDGDIVYQNNTDLNLLSSTGGNNSLLTVNTLNLSTLNTIGNQNGYMLNLTASGNLQLNANEFLETKSLNFTAGQMISGKNLTEVPTLISPFISLTAQQVASQTATIDLNILGLLTNTLASDASNQTSLGTSFNYTLITTRLLRSLSDLYYVYPLINGQADVVAPIIGAVDALPVFNTVNTIATVNQILGSEDNQIIYGCSFASESLKDKFPKNQNDNVWQHGLCDNNRYQQTNSHNFLDVEVIDRPFEFTNISIGKVKL